MQSLRRGSFCNKRTRLAPTSVTADSSRCFGRGKGGGLRCLALTRMSRRLLQLRQDIRGGEGSASLHRCEHNII